MTTFVLGVCGFVTALFLFTAGFAGGWTLRGKMPPCRTATVCQTEPPDEETKRKLEDERKAFQIMQNYSAADAYGLYNRTVSVAGGT